MDIKSRSEKKREALLLQELGERLCELPSTEIEKIDLPEEIYSAVKLAKSIKKGGALKRQLQYIGVLMRRIDPEPIKQALQNIKEGNLRSQYK